MRKIIPIIIDFIQFHKYTTKELFELLFIYTYITHNDDIYEFIINNDILFCEEIFNVLIDLKNSKDIFINDENVIYPAPHKYVEDISDMWIYTSIDLFKKIEISNKTINQLKIEYYNTLHNISL